MTKKEKLQEAQDLFKNIIFINDVKDYGGVIMPRHYTLRECYNNYSIYKEQAYDFCKNVIKRLVNANYSISYYGIYSYNIFQFTFVINFEKDKKYCLYISKDKNTLYC